MDNSQQKLISWYQKNARDLPWRVSKDPYKIWISEVMLQQTTVKAVVPYYNNFLKSFPTVSTLSNATESQVLKHWAGLGYYRRAKLLHKASKILVLGDFPKKYSELIELPGFGPYTSRAVSSLAFDENVGLVDGNVIRVLSRKFGMKNESWKSAGRNVIQGLADEMVEGASSSIVNQAMMELGATICTPQSPKCWNCPWVKNCVSFEKNLVEKLPLLKPRRAREIWVWRPSVQMKGGRLALTKNNYAPFLKNQWILPGRIKKETRAPQKFHVRHSITHHDIFVLIDRKKRILKNLKWIREEDLSSISPTSLVQKTLNESKKQVLKK